MKNIIYRVTKRIGLLKGFTEQIETRMELMYPGEREKVIRNTEFELIKIVVMMFAVVMAFVIYGGVGPVYIFMAICVVYLLSKHMVYTRYDHLEMKLLRQFERFISEVRFQFKYDGMIDEAILEAVQNTGYEMELQGNLIYESLNDTGVTNCDKALYEKNDYMDIAPNHFLMTFYALCETVKTYGDKKIDGKSIFLTNLSYLKEEVNVEILKREKMNASFMGLMGVTVMPVFAIKPICMWGISNISGLADYYSGVFGNMTMITITVLTVIIAGIIMKLKYQVDYDNHKNDFVTGLLEIDLIDKMLMKVIRKRYRHYYEQDLFLKSIVYRYNIKEFMVYRMVCAITAFTTSMILGISIGFYGEKIAGLLILCFVSGLVGILAYYYEYALLFIRKRLLKLNREEEVVRFQSIILILMNMDRITIETILMWMEKFAVVFKNNIEVIADNITYKGNAIFMEIRDKVNFLPFERLMDCFMACDKVGISNAFSDIASDRLYYVEKHKQENEIIINHKAMIAKLIAFIPICMVIIFVLVVPFIYEGLNQLWDFNTLY